MTPENTTFPSILSSPFWFSVSSFLCLLFYSVVHSHPCLILTNRCHSPGINNNPNEVRLIHCFIVFGEINDETVSRVFKAVTVTYAVMSVDWRCTSGRFCVACRCVQIVALRRVLSPGVLRRYCRQQPQHHSATPPATTMVRHRDILPARCLVTFAWYISGRVPNLYFVLSLANVAW